jgi:hypothetical protein
MKYFSFNVTLKKPHLEAAFDQQLPSNLSLGLFTANRDFTFYIFLFLFFVLV